MLLSADQALADLPVYRPHDYEKIAANRSATPDQIDEWFAELHKNSDYSVEDAHTAYHHDPAPVHQHDHEAQIDDWFDFHEPEATHHHYRTVSREAPSPSSQITTLNDLLFNAYQVHQKGETLFDDHSSVRSRYGANKEEIVNSELTMHERDDGILEMFLDRFTTIFNHERIYLQDIPHDHHPHDLNEQAEWHIMSHSPATHLAEQLLTELNEDEPNQNSAVDNHRHGDH